MSDEEGEVVGGPEGRRSQAGWGGGLWSGMGSGSEIVEFSLKSHV